MTDQITQQWKLLARKEHELGPEDLELTPILDNLAFFYHSEWQYEPAESCYKRSLSIREKHYGRTSAELLPTLQCLGYILRVAEKFQEAESLYVRALSIAKQTWGDQSIESAGFQNLLSGLYFAWKRYELARDLMRSSRHIYKLCIGENHSTVGMAYIAEAILLKELGDDEGCLEAITASRAALSGEFDKSLTSNLSRLSRILLEKGEHEDASRLFRFSLILQAQAIFPHHPLVAKALIDLGKMYEQKNEPATAAIFYESGLQLMEGTQDITKPAYMNAANDLAAIYVELESFEKARDLLDMLDTMLRRSAKPSQELKQAIRDNRIKLLKQKSLSH